MYASRFFSCFSSSSAELADQNSEPATSRRKRVAGEWILTVLVLLLWPAFVRCQEVTATITGTVVDPSGAPIVGAKITANDTRRGTQWTAETNGVGSFNLPRLPIGNYEVK